VGHLRTERRKERGFAGEIAVIAVIADIAVIRKPEILLTDQH
jgi:hypothetical protein